MAKMSDEKRREMSERMKARWAEKRANKDVESTTPIEHDVPLPEINSDTKVEDMPEQDMQTILKQALEAIATLAKMQGTPVQTSQGIGMNAAGKLTGTVERYSLDPNRYPSPVERLMDEPKLQRFGFKENYELRYEFRPTQAYTTIDNIRMIEPEFVLDLVKVVYNEETGERTQGRYVLYRVVMHEDPSTALHIARTNGIEIPDDATDERHFLNEMRYIQMRDWLFECFYKPKSTGVSNKREMVIDGKLVEYFEINSEKSASIPFSQLDNKL